MISIDIHFPLAKSQKINHITATCTVCRVTNVLRGLVCLLWSHFPDNVFHWNLQDDFLLPCAMRSPPRAYCNFCSPSIDQETKKLNWAPPPDPLNSVLCCLITVDVSTLPLGSVDTGREKLMGWIGGIALITSFIITATSSTLWVHSLTISSMCVYSKCIRPVLTYVSCILKTALQDRYYYNPMWQIT